MHIFLTISLTGILIPIILKFLTWKSQSSKSCSPYTFRYSKYLSIIFIAGLIIIIVLFVWVCLSGFEPKLELEIFLLSFYSIFTFAIILQILKVLNFQLKLEEEFMLYSNLFGIVRKISYEEITKIKIYKDKSHNVIKYKIYIGETRIVIENFATNFNDFPKIMKRRLKTVKNNLKFE